MSLAHQRVDITDAMMVCYCYIYMCFTSRYIKPISFHSFLPCIAHEILLIQHALIPPSRDLLLRYWRNADRCQCHHLGSRTFFCKAVNPTSIEFFPTRSIQRRFGRATPLGRSTHSLLCEIMMPISTYRLLLTAAVVGGGGGTGDRTSWQCWHGSV